MDVGQTDESAVDSYSELVKTTSLDDCAVVCIDSVGGDSVSESGDAKT